MRRSLLASILASVLILTAVTIAPADPVWRVYFSPRGGATTAVVNVLAGAKVTIRVQAYAFTSAPIAKALVEAHGRGVDVQIILDRTSAGSKYSSADSVACAKIVTFTDGAHAIAHNKVMVIDDLAVITGSFNFTTGAEQRNAENLLVIRSKALAARYTANWQAHALHSTRYVANKC